MAAVVAYWVFLDGTVIRPVIKFENQLQLKTEKSVYHPGDKVRVYMTYCKSRDITPSFETALIDEHLILYEMELGTSAVIGCKTNVLVDFEIIPPDTYATTYHFTRVLHYQVNPMRTIDVRLQTNQFQVVK